jgi:hypothetical protein
MSGMYRALTYSLLANYKPLNGRGVITMLRIHSDKLSSSQCHVRPTGQSTHSFRQKICPHPTNLVTPQSSISRPTLPSPSLPSSKTEENGTKHIGQLSSRSTSSFPNNGRHSRTMRMRSWFDPGIGMGGSIVEHGRGERKGFGWNMTTVNEGNAWRVTSRGHQKRGWLNAIDELNRLFLSTF